MSTTRLIWKNRVFEKEKVTVKTHQQEKLDFCIFTVAVVHHWSQLWRWTMKFLQNVRLALATLADYCVFSSSNAATFVVQTRPFSVWLHSSEQGQCAICISSKRLRGNISKALNFDSWHGRIEEGKSRSIYEYAWDAHASATPRITILPPPRDTRPATKIVRRTNLCRGRTTWNTVAVFVVG